MVRSIFCFRRVSIPYVWGAPGARGLRSFVLRSTGRLESPSDGRSSAVFSFQPAQGAFTASVPTLSGSRPALLSRGTPGGGGSARTAVRSSRGADSGLVTARAATPPSLDSPGSPLPDTFVTAPVILGAGRSAIRRLGRGLPDPRGAVPTRCLPPPTRARPEPSSRHAPEGARHAFGTVGSGTCDEAPPGPSGSTLGGRRTPRRASQHLDGFCDRRLANSCSRPSSRDISRRALDRKRKRRLKRSFSLHKRLPTSSTPETGYNSQAFHKLSTASKAVSRSHPRYNAD